jgi:hypothetical protein
MYSIMALNIHNPQLRKVEIYQRGKLQTANSIGGVKVGVLATGKYTTLRRKDKDLLTQNSDNVSEWSDIPTNRQRQSKLNNPE